MPVRRDGVCSQRVVVIPNRPTLSATAHSLGATGPEVLRGDVLVVRNTFNVPIAIFVMLGPQLHQMYSICHDPQEFQSALRQHGIESGAIVEPMKI